VASCGLKVSKHGNRSASGNVGSADFLEGLGANIMLDADKVLETINGCNFGFLFAQKFHPAMRFVMPARKQLGVPTVFNVLGPLTNPCKPSAQLIGVGKPHLAPLYAEIFAARSGKTMIVHSSEGLDEISIAAPTTAWICEDGNIREEQVSPADFGLPTHNLDLVQGGTVAERCGWFAQILDETLTDEQRGPQVCAIRDYCIINAAAALWVAGVCEDYKSATAMIQGKLADGSAKATVAKYVEISNS
jgi:anthranilate phosphoribosyltransferase